MLTPKSLSGFTLIEVVVALAILATALYGGVFLLNRTTVNTYHIRDTVLANWVATNAFANAVLAGSDLDGELREEESVTMYGDTFLLTVHEQQNPDAQSGERSTSILTIQVAKPATPESLLENIVVYRPQ
jgi:type II secretion system protein I